MYIYIQGEAVYDMISEQNLSLPHHLFGVRENMVS